MLGQVLLHSERLAASEPSLKQAKPHFLGRRCRGQGNAECGLRLISCLHGAEASEAMPSARSQSLAYAKQRARLRPGPSS